MNVIDLKMSTLKPLSAKWVIGWYDYIKTKPEIVINGFKGAGKINETITQHNNL